MASLLYTLGCGILAGLAVLELKTQHRTPRIQLYVTLLCAMVFCGGFALLVALATIAGGQYQAIATAGVLLLTAGSLFAVTRTTRRFRELQAAQQR